MSVGFIYLVVFLFVASLFGGIYMLTRDFGKTSEEERLDVLTGRRRDEQDSESLQSLMKGGDLLKETANGASSLVSSISAKFTGLAEYLQQANCNISPDKFLTMVLGGMLLGEWIRWSTGPRSSRSTRTPTG